MIKESKEPAHLKRGKKFHKIMQEKWKITTKGLVTSEKPIVKPSGRSGRIDVYVEDEDENNNLVAVVEFKASDWDSMTLKAVKRNVKRYARQIWNYIDSKENLVKAVSPGIIFQKSPLDHKRKELIEEIFHEILITVVWDDESD